MTFILLTKSTTFLIGPIAAILGYVMEAIYDLFALLGVRNVGLSIILFTVIVNLLMLPLTIKQQKYTRMNSIMNPEIQAIQKKYKDKKDQISMQKQQVEMQAVYDKYGSSPTSGCLPLIIQLPIMFALYRVIWNIPAYINEIKEVYLQVATPLQNIFTSQAVINAYPEFVELASSNALSVEKYDYTQVNRIIDLLYKFDASEWESLKSIFPSLSGVIETTAAQVTKLNSFIGGISLMAAPGFRLSIALIIPILAGVTQWLSVKLTGDANQTAGDDSTAATTMRSMNIIMPLFSAFICITLPSCIGLYWIASSVASTVIRMIINGRLKKVPVEDLVRENVAKQNKKRARKGLPPISEDASVRTSQKAKEIADRNAQVEKMRRDKLKEAKAEGKVPETNIDKIKTGSIASKAMAVKEYNEKHAKK